MESDGLTIEGKEFSSLSAKKQLMVLYQNQVETLRLMKSYSFHQKVQYVLIVAALGGIGILFKMHLPGA
jgi:hypothetical protein